MATRLLAFLFCAAVLPSSAADTILVGAFSNRTHNASLGWIGESISESLREAIAASPLPVVSRDDRQEAVRNLSLHSSTELTLASLVKLSQSLGASRLLYGRFELAAPSRALRITACVLDLASRSQAAEFSLQGPPETLSELESDLAWQVLGWLRPNQTPSRAQFRSPRPQVNLKARENYIRGLLAAAPEQRHRYFTQAARLDSAFPHPAFALGRMHFLDENYREAAAWLEKVPASSVLGMEATFFLGLSRFELSDTLAARQAFERVAAERPSSEVWNNLGAVLARLNHPDSLDYFRRALQSAPADPDYQFNLGYTFWKRGDYTTAAGHFRAVLDRIPNDEDAILLLGRCLKQSGPRQGDWRSEGLERLKDSLDLSRRP